MTNGALERLVEAFGAEGPRCGRWWARCPIHDDQNPSLEIFEFDGSACFLCWVCCPGGTPKEFATKVKTTMLRLVGLEWSDVLGSKPMDNLPKQNIVARYPYRDEDGVLLYECVRLEPGRNGRKKDFKQRRPDPDNPRKWVWNLEGCRRVLYKLSDLLRVRRDQPDRPILLVGGEKDADVGWKLGFPTTTNVCGEGSKWFTEYTETLKGAKVVLVPHRDPTGWRHMAGVAYSLIADGGCRVRWLALPGATKPGYDLADFAAGLSIKDAKIALEKLIAKAPEFPQWNLLTMSFCVT